MRLMSGAFIFIFSLAARAEIQVPENCINKVYPCLVRADSALDFKQANITIGLTPKTIVKMTSENGQINLELLTGRMSVVERELTDMPLLINSVLADSPRLLIKRERDELDVVSLTNFTKTRYLINVQNNSLPVRVRSQFISKSEFVDFTRHYFKGIKDFKNFLASVESSWKTEFTKQNESQTKALIRSVASEEQEAEDRIRKEQELALEKKKVKEAFFFRTFNR